MQTGWKHPAIQNPCQGQIWPPDTWVEGLGRENSMKGAWLQGQVGGWRNRCACCLLRKSRAGDGFMAGRKMSCQWDRSVGRWVRHWKGWVVKPNAWLGEGLNGSWHHGDGEFDGHEGQGGEGGSGRGANIRLKAAVLSPLAVASRSSAGMHSAGRRSATPRVTKFPAADGPTAEAASDADETPGDPARRRPAHPSPCRRRFGAGAALLGVRGLGLSPACCWGAGHRNRPGPLRHQPAVADPLRPRPWRFGVHPGASVPFLGRSEEAARSRGGIARWGGRGGGVGFAAAAAPVSPLQEATVSSKNVARKAGVSCWLVGSASRR